MADAKTNSGEQTDMELNQFMCVDALEQPRANPSISFGAYPITVRLAGKSFRDVHPDSLTVSLANLLRL